MNTPRRSWLRLLPLLAMVGLLVTGLTRVTTAASHYVLTTPTANSVWLAGSTMQIQWTGGPPATPVKLVLADVPSWTTTAIIDVNIPNTGSYTWTIPANLPTSTYLVYIEAMDQSTWAYGPDFTIQTVNVRPDLSIMKKPVDPLLAGQNASYHIMVTNVGSGPAAGPITVTDTLGAGLSFVSATGSGWTCSAVGQTVTCTQPGPLAAGQSLPLLTLTVAIARDVTVAENCASVATGQNAGTPGDGNPENDRTCVKGEVTPPPVGDPCGVKFDDLNGNGTQDPGEPGLSGWTIQIQDAMGNVVATTVTGPGGRYCFKELKAGTYTISEVNQAGWTQTYPAAPGTHTVTVGSAMSPTTLINFGNLQRPPVGGVCGVKFNDVNGNGIQDSGEAGLPGWTIEIKDAQGNVIAQVVTDENGQFCVKGLPFGTYTISEVNQAGWTQTYPVSGSYTTTLDAMHPTCECLLFGNRKTVITSTICGVKFNDLNGNGIQDAGEPGLPGWTIEIRDAQGNLVATGVTDSDGRFCFEGLKPGTYTVSEVNQAGWTQTFPAVLGTHTVTVGMAQARAYTPVTVGKALAPTPVFKVEIKFGNQQQPSLVSVCGVKFNDLNGNGIQDLGEPGLQGWTIQIKDAQGNVISQVVSDRNGRFCFDDLKPGTYTFSEVLQPGWAQTYPTAPGIHTVSVISGQKPRTIAFGNQQQADPCCLTSRLTAGRADNFSVAGAPEGAYPSLALVQALGNFNYAHFDESQMDRFFAHTFWLPADNCLKSAQLEIKAKPLGNGSMVSNDSINLRFSGVPGSPTWGSYFGNPPNVGLVSNQWSLTNYPGGQTFTLDLGNLPGGTNLLPWLQSQRFLDVQVQDDTAVDYMVLTMEFCECADVTEPVGDTVSVVPKTVVRLQLDSVNATVNGEDRKMAAPALLRDNSTLVPLRWIGEALGAEIQWDGDERKVTFLQAGRVVEIWIDRTRAVVDGRETTLSVAPTLIGGSTYVPVRFISEALGAEVLYDPADRSIMITYSR